MKYIQITWVVIQVSKEPDPDIRSSEVELIPQIQLLLWEWETTLRCSPSSASGSCECEAHLEEQGTWHISPPRKKSAAAVGCLSFAVKWQINCYSSHWSHSKDETQHTPGIWESLEARNGIFRSCSKGQFGHEMGTEIHPGCSGSKYEQRTALV